MIKGQHLGGGRDWYSIYYLRLQNLLIHIINRLFAFFANLFIYFLFKLIRVCLLHNFKVGSVEEARKAVDVGVDAIIVQGLEAGGHVRGKVSPVLCSVA